jgi:SPP1 gp7 family putative phage head morphogenesis protein
MLKNNCLCCNDRLSILDAKRSDPTGTLSLRGKFEQKLVGKFNRLKTLINQSIVQNDAFGLKAQRIGDSIPQSIIVDAQALPIRAFTFERPAEKVDRFMSWLQQAQNDGILEVQQGASMSSAARASWMNTYIDTSYAKGVRDAASKMRKSGASVAESWTEQSFFRPIHADRLGLIHTRAYSDLDGITKTMDQQISRILAQGIGEGRGPLDIARQINERIEKIGITRARVLARTEIVSAHAEATLNAYEEAKIEGVEVEAEFTTAGDNAVCPECEALAGKVFTIAESRGMIPVHPSCRCAFNPIVVGGTGIELL